MLKWAWPAIAFLIFMIPLPWRLEKALGPPLQYLATLASTYTLADARIHGVLRGQRDPA